MAQSGKLITEGFESFSQGTFGNAGQNIYVSRGGVLQRIHRFDVNSDGYIDLVICNSQNHCERPPAYVYHDVLGTVTRTELPSFGALSGILADLNGDGYQDLVMAMDYDGIRHELNAIVYYGSPDGLSEHYQLHLPAPRANCVTAGDFNGDGRPDLAFLCSGRLRLFYQNELGFEPKRYLDLDIEAQQLTAADIDGDGFADLYALTNNGQALVLWGGPEGIDVTRFSELPVEYEFTEERSIQDEMASEAERVEPILPLPSVVRLQDVPHLLVPNRQRAFLVPAKSDRGFGSPMVIECPRVLAAAVGDINGDGYPDLAIASRGFHKGTECSWIYWGSAEGFSAQNRTPVRSRGACDIAVADLDDNGFDDVVICQDRSEESFSFHSQVYRGGVGSPSGETTRLYTHDARRVLVGRTCDDPLPQVIFVNHRARRAGGDVDPVIYFGSSEGFSQDHCQHLRGIDAVQAVCCDLNDDGYPDIVMANCAENAVHLDPGTFIFMGGPDGLSYEPTLTLATTRAHGVCCGDLNHDGYLDVVVCGFAFPDILVFYGSARGFDSDSPQRIRMEIDGTVYDNPRWIYLADLNNDGWLDLVIPLVVSDRSAILWGGPEGFDIERRQMLSAINGSYCRAADLTGNGWLDLIIGSHGTAEDSPCKAPHDSFVYIYWNGPDGLREDRRTQLPANAVNGMSVADFDNDGVLDLFVCSYLNGISRDINSYIYWGGEGGTLSAADFTPLFTHSASGSMAADFNEDGWIDIAVANHKLYGDHAGYSCVWWNGPDGFSEERTTRLPSLGPHGMLGVDAGNQRDRGPEEYYVSAPFELPPGAVVEQITWQAQVPAKTWVRAQLRFAQTRPELEDAPWQGPTGSESWLECGDQIAGMQQASWVQYRLALGARGGGNTPRVSQVCLDYS